MRREQYGWPKLLGSVVGGILTYGGIVAVVGLIWAGATGSSLVFGALIGAATGSALGIFQGLIAVSNTARLRRRSIIWVSGAMIGGPLLLGMIGLIVWLIRVLL